MPVFEAPSDIVKRDYNKAIVFLAGSIEMGRAIEWQKECSNRLSSRYNVLNPRRSDWDATWKQDINNNQFRTQVEWELDGLEIANYIILFLAADTKSPISLLEFGLYAKAGKLLVVCEEGFWRKGNIDIVCLKYEIPQFHSLEDVLDFLESKK